MNKAIIVRIIAVFIVIVVARNFIPDNLNSFPYSGDIQVQYDNPYSISVMANFDGVHYVKIASEGYKQFNQAFFPLYPLLIKFLAVPLNNNHVVAGILISTISFFAGCVILFKLLSEIYGLKKALYAVILLLVFPTSFFFQMVYTEGLFLLVCTAALYFIHKKRYLWVIIFAAISSLIRIQGIFLFFPIVFSLYDFKKPIFNNIFSIIKKHFVLLIAPFIGLSCYMVYLNIYFHDPLYFFTAQPSFGAQRSTSLILLPQVYFRYLKIFITASHNFQYFVAVMEFIFFNISFVASLFFGYRAYKHKNAFECGIALFSLAYIILPTLTGTFSSLPRYTLMALSQYLFFAKMKNSSYQKAIIFISVLIQIVLLSLFSRGYFIS